MFDGRLLSGLTVIALVAMFALTSVRVTQRIQATRRAVAQLIAYRDFADACAREVAAGARVVDAVAHASDGVRGAPESAALVARQVRLGGQPGDVAEAELAEFGQLWELSNRHGLSFAPLADSVVDDCDAQLAQQEKTSAAMAGARMTEILLLILPIGALAVGESLGLGPVELLFGNAIGMGLMLVGGMLACAGVLWTEALTVRVLGGVGRRAGPTPGVSVAPELVVARHIELFALALRAGLPIASAWQVACTVVPTPEIFSDATACHEVTAMLALGAGGDAWEPLIDHKHYGPIARQARQQATAGTRLAEGAAAQASRLRTTALRQAEAGAEKILIVMAAPLTLCFLPAFVLVGLVPLVAGLAGI